MKEISKLTKIELTEEEEKLLAQINFDPIHDSAEYDEILRSSCEAAVALTESILARQAVPAVRRRYFTDPKLNIGTKKNNGCRYLNKTARRLGI